MTNLWKNNLRKITPYTPGEQSQNRNIIKLNANENPYPPSPKAIAAIQEYPFERLRLYPDANALALKETIAKSVGLATNQVFVGNGSDEVLAFIYMGCFQSQKPILFPDITYSFYPVWCSLYNTPYKTMPLDESFAICPTDYHMENGGILLPNPNAPTGMGQSQEAIIDILLHNTDSIVVIDEAYADFGEYSAIALLQDYENLVVVQTFSKSRSLAGMRIGMAYGSPTVISTLETVKNSYNSYTMDSLAIAAGTAAMMDNDYFAQVTANIKATRDRSALELKKLGFSVYPSQSNFLFVTHPHKKAKYIFEALRQRNIFVRHFDLPRIANHLRISIGTDDEMKKLLQALQQIV